MPDAAPPTPHRPGFLRQVLRLAGPYWNCDRKWKVRGATLGLFLLTVAQVGLTVWGNYWNRALYDALEKRSVAGVALQVGVFALILATSLVVTGAHLLVKRWLQLDWRAWLTDRLVGRWMEDARHYRLNFIPGEHDNPDGRIADDIHIATETAVSMAHTLVYCLLVLNLFIPILWSVSGSLQVPGTSLTVPGYLVPLAFLYAGIGSALGWTLGRPLVRTTNALQTAEASFRFGLARGRDRSEDIALARGEPVERAGAGANFAAIVRDWNRQSLAYLGIVSFSTAYGSLLPVFPILVAAPQYIAGVMSLGVLMQAAQAFQSLTGALSWPVDSLGDIARVRASADRVLSLYGDMERLDQQATLPDPHRITLGTSGTAHLVIEDLCIAEPSGLVQLEPTSLDVRRGERVLITGDPSVTGAFFKVLGGLWPWGSGRVFLPDDGGFMFMPQRPFLPEGTLRAALCYPRPCGAFDEAWIRHGFECAGLSWLAPRLDESANWEQALPLRTRQSLALARVLIHRPAWLFLEEATDAFDPKGERLILEMLEHELPDTTLLTVSFHPGLENLHHRRVVLEKPAAAKYLFGGPAAAQR